MNDSFEFLVQKDITFLNFGSFGSCPKEIFSFYQQKQLELERQPVSFIVEKGIKELNQAREALATYVNCGPDDLVFVINPSYAINTIAKSFPMSIAIAQGKNVLQEYWPERKDCLFFRKNLVTKDHYFFEKLLL